MAGDCQVGRLSPLHHVVSQIVGAVLASFALWLLLPEHRGLMGAHVPAIPAVPSVAMDQTTPASRATALT